MTLAFLHLACKTRDVSFCCYTLSMLHVTLKLLNAATQSQALQLNGTLNGLILAS